jgi:hypothetical protein
MKVEELSLNLISDDKYCTLQTLCSVMVYKVIV